MAGPEDQTLVQTHLKQLQEVAAQVEKPELKIYALKKAPDATITTALATLAPTATVTVSTDGKRLIVVAKPEDQVTIEKTLQQMQASVDATKAVLETYQVEGMTTTQLQALLLPLVKTATISVDAQQERLIVWGPQDEQDALSAVVEQLKQDPLTSTKPELKFYPIAEPLYENAITVLTDLTPSAKVTWEAEGKRLMVVAPPKEQLIVQQTIEQLSQNALPAEDQRLEVYQLSTTQLARFTAIQPELLTRLPGIRVVPDAQTGELAIWAKPSQHGELKQLLEQLSGGVATSGKPVLIGYTIENGSAKSVFAMLQEVYPTTKLTLDEKTGRIIAFASLEEQARIKQSIAQLDAATQPDLEESLKTYATEQVSPTTLLPTLQELVPEMRLTADVQHGRVVAWGTARDHEILQKAFEQYRDGDPAQRPIVRAYPIPGQTSTSLVQIQSVLAQVAPQAVLAVDTRGGGIVASAREADHAEIKTAIEQMVEMDRQSKASLESYELDAINATQAIAALRGVVPNAYVGPGVEPQHIIVWATPEDHQKILETLKKIEDTKAGDGTRKLQMHRVHPKAAAQLTTAMATTLPDLQVLGGQSTGELMVWGTDKNHKRLDQLIQQLESEMGVDVQREIVVYDLDDVTAADAQRVLSEAVSDLEFLTTTAPDRLVIRAEAEKHKQVKVILDELKKSMVLPEQVIRVYPFDEDDVSASQVYLALSTANLLVGMTVQVNVATNSLIARGSEKRQEEFNVALQQLVDQLPRAEKPYVEVYKLKRANPTSVSLVVRQLVPTAVLAVDVAGKTLSATAKKDEHERIRAAVEQIDAGDEQGLETKVYPLKLASPVTLVTALTPVVPGATLSYDLTTNSLIATGTGEDHQKIDPLVKQLDVVGPNARVLRTYQAKNANPTDVYATLQAMYRYSSKAIIGFQATTGTIFVFGPEAEQETVSRLIDEIDQTSPPQVVKVYPFKDEKVDAATVDSALSDDVKKGLDVQVNAATNSLIVRGPEKEQQVLADALAQLMEQLPEAEKPIARVYRLSRANPLSLSLVLRQLIPTGTFAGDATAMTLAATASEEDHKRIKEVVEQADGAGEGKLETRVYAFKFASPATVMTAIKPVVPSATLGYDVTTNSLLVTATEEDHRQIAPLVEKLDVTGPNTRVLKTYQVKNAVPRDVFETVQLMYRYNSKAIVYFREATGTIFVFGPEAEHETVARVVEEIDQAMPDHPVRVYPFREEKVDAQVALDALGDEVTKGLEIQVNEDTNTLIVRGPEARQTSLDTALKQLMEQLPEADKPIARVYHLQRANPTPLSLMLRRLVPDGAFAADPTTMTLAATARAKDQERIKAVVEQADGVGDGELQTQVYFFKLANPSAVMEAIEPLVPGATMSADTSTNSLIVTATAQDHKQIEPLTGKLDVENPNAPVLKTYHVENADPNEVYQSLTLIYRYNRDISVGYQDATGSILVVAAPADHESVGKAIEEIDKMSPNRAEQSLQVYSLVGMDGRSTVNSLETLLEDMKPKIDMDYDYNNSQVLVMAEPEQHVVIGKMLEQLKPEEREVEVFTLRRVEPYAVQSAIDSLFADLPFSAAPAVDTDEGTQQLIVRATKEQIERIRQLLEKMGEGPEASRDSKSEGLMRIVPFSGDVESTLKQIEAIWPQMRGNPLKVVVPDAKPEPGKTESPAENDKATEGVPDQPSDGKKPADDQNAQFDPRAKPSHDNRAVSICQRAPAVGRSPAGDGECPARHGPAADRGDSWSRATDHRVGRQRSLGSIRGITRDVAETTTDQCYLGELCCLSVAQRGCRRRRGDARPTVSAHFEIKQQQLVLPFTFATPRCVDCGG